MARPGWHQPDHTPACTCSQCNKRRLEQLGTRPRFNADFFIVLLILVSSGAIAVGVVFGFAWYSDRQDSGAEAATQSEVVPAASRSARWVEAVENEVVRIVNQVRREQGFGALVVNSEMRTLARQHSEYMGRTGDYRNSDDGFGENVTKVPVGYTTMTYLELPLSLSRETVGDPQEVALELVASWLESPGLRENILLPQYRATGVGVAVVNARGGDEGDGELIYVTQNFSQ